MHSVMGGGPLPTLSTEHFTVRVPPSFTRLNLDQAGVDLVLAAAEADAIFRPSLVATSQPSSAPLVEASAAALRAVGLQHPGARLVSVDVFTKPGSSASDAPIGRIIVFAYPLSDDVEVLVKKWVFATGRHHLHFSASFLPSQARAVEDTFDWIVAGLDFACPMQSLREAAARPAWDVSLVDRDGSARTQFPLEDLAELPLSLPQSAEALPLPYLRNVAQAWGVDLDHPQVVSVRLRRGDSLGFYSAYLSAVGVLVLRSSGSRAADFVPDKFEAVSLPAQRLPVDLFAWLGGKPAFEFSAPQSLSESEYEAKIADQSGGDGWLEVGVHFRDRSMLIVSTGGVGLRQAWPNGVGMFELDVLPSGHLFRFILENVDMALGG